MKIETILLRMKENPQSNEVKINTYNDFYNKLKAFPSNKYQSSFIKIFDDERLAIKCANGYLNKIGVKK